MSLIGLLISLLIIVLVVLVVRWAMDQLAVPANIRAVVLVIIAILVLVWFIQELGLLGGGGPVLRLR